MCAAGKNPNECAHCPDFTYDGDNPAPVQLLMRGSFTGPFPEALVTLTGCETHAYNWGGTVLVRKVAGGWIPILYAAGVVEPRCEARVVDGVTLLACRERYGVNMGGFVTSASVIDLSRRLYHSLLMEVCVSGVDVDRVAWSKTGAEVEVAIRHGMTRDNEGGRCVDVKGRSRMGTLKYGRNGSAYEPSAVSKELLLAIAPQSVAPLDPEQQKVVQSSAQIPEELLPSSSELQVTEICAP